MFDIMFSIHNRKLQNFQYSRPSLTVMAPMEKDKSLCLTIIEYENKIEYVGPVQYSTSDIKRYINDAWTFYKLNFYEICEIMRSDSFQVLAPFTPYNDLIYVCNDDISGYPVLLSIDDKYYYSCDDGSLYGAIPTIFELDHLYPVTVNLNEIMSKLVK